MVVTTANPRTSDNNNTTSEEENLKNHGRRIGELKGWIAVALQETMMMIKGVVKPGFAAKMHIQRWSLQPMRRVTSTFIRSFTSGSQHSGTELPSIWNVESLQMSNLALQLPFEILNAIQSNQPRPDQVDLGENLAEFSNCPAPELIPAFVAVTHSLKPEPQDSTLFLKGFLNQACHLFPHRARAWLDLLHHHFNQALGDPSSPLFLAAIEGCVSASYVSTNVMHAALSYTKFSRLVNLSHRDWVAENFLDPQYLKDLYEGSHTATLKHQVLDLVWTSYFLTGETSALPLVLQCMVDQWQEQPSGRTDLMAHCIHSLVYTCMYDNEVRSWLDAVAEGKEPGDGNIELDFQFDKIRGVAQLVRKWVDDLEGKGFGPDGEAEDSEADATQFSPSDLLNSVLPGDHEPPTLTKGVRMLEPYTHYHYVVTEFGAYRLHPTQPESPGIAYAGSLRDYILRRAKKEHVESEVNPWLLTASPKASVEPSDAIQDEWIQGLDITATTDLLKVLGFDWQHVSEGGKEDEAMLFNHSAFLNTMKSLWALGRKSGWFSQLDSGTKSTALSLTKAACHTSNLFSMAFRCHPFLSLASARAHALAFRASLPEGFIEVPDVCSTGHAAVLDAEGPVVLQEWLKIAAPQLYEQEAELASQLALLNVPAVHWYELVLDKLCVFETPFPTVYKYSHMYREQGQGHIMWQDSQGAEPEAEAELSVADRRGAAGWVYKEYASLLADINRSGLQAAGPMLQEAAVRDDTESVRLLAVVLHRLGNKKQALHMIREYMKIVPGDQKAKQLEEFWSHVEQPR